jgi:hypothetical protein
MTAPADRFRIVVFTGGAVLEDACVEFIGRLDEHPDLELAGVFCQARGVGLRGVVADLLERRGWLAPPLLIQRGLRRLGGILLLPWRELRRRSILRRCGPRIHVEPDLHAPAVLSKVQALAPQLGAVYGGPILRPELFTIPSQGTLGIHHGRLPDYRGKKTTFWALYHGETTVGVAIQRIGSGLDRGDVLRDATLEAGSLPLPVVSRRLERLGLELYLDAVLGVQKGDAVFRPQPTGSAPLFKDPRGRDIARFWLRYLLRLYSRLGAARSPGP